MRQLIKYHPCKKIHHVKAFLTKLVLFIGVIMFSFLSHAQVKYTVNSIDDFEDIDLADEFCADKNGNCTLRAAIQNSNKSTNRDTINFGIPGCGPFSIILNEILPVIVQPVDIDATTQQGFSINSLKIIISGEKIPSPPIRYEKAVPKGLNFQGNSSGSRVRGLVIHSFSGFAIFLQSEDNIIQSNYLGINADGNSAAGNICGISIKGSRNLIGGECAGERNVISGNNNAIMLYSNNRVIGNYIGTNIDGTKAIGNRWGIEMPFHSIGSELSSNLISGNEIGLSCQGENNLITYNLIGTDISGTQSLSNEIGLRLSGGRNNFVGGRNKGNLISGNDIGVWVHLRNPDIQNNILLGNYVGVDISGLKPLPNNVGIRLDTGGQNIIGGSGEGLQNIISGNRLSGIEIKNSFGNYIYNNYIGTDHSAEKALPNGTGIKILNDHPEYSLGDNHIEHNIIAGNLEMGIQIENSYLNTIRRNFIGYSPRIRNIIPNGSFDIKGGGSIYDNCIGSKDPLLDNIHPEKNILHLISYN